MKGEVSVVVFTSNFREKTKKERKKERDAGKRCSEKAPLLLLLLLLFSTSSSGKDENGVHLLLHVPRTLSIPTEVRSYSFWYHPVCSNLKNLESMAVPFSSKSPVYFSTYSRISSTQSCSNSHTPPTGFKRRSIPISTVNFQRCHRGDDHAVAVRIPRGEKSHRDIPLAAHTSKQQLLDEGDGH